MTLNNTYKPYLVYISSAYNNTIGGGVGYGSRLFDATQQHGRKGESNIEFFFENNTKTEAKFNKTIEKVKRIVTGKANYYIKSRRSLLEQTPSEKFHIKFIDRPPKIIHCHSSKDVLRIRNWNTKNNLNIKIIFTVHNPINPFLEYKERLSKKIITKYGIKTFNKACDIEKDIHNNAIKFCDGFTFPCEPAIEGLKKTWKEFACLISAKPVQYFLTGANTRKPTKTAGEIKRNLQLNKSDIIICFAGRHTKVKGYDLLKQAAIKILDAEKQVFFIILGEEKPLTGLKHHQWIEVGWCSDVANYLQIADLIVAPNRETYFDLGIIEYMSQGKAIITTNTGGNKIFRNMTSGIILIEPEAEQLLNAIRQLKTDSKTLHKMGVDNKNMYLKHFTLEQFAEGFQNVVNNFLEDINTR
ncbi:MAG: glycosyltransferase family 4 protein [Pseudomonadota bacterium]|nr:glycosyltransferase family 4 protein [Pseudomonadota bacterium]